MCLVSIAWSSRAVVGRPRPQVSEGRWTIRVSGLDKVLQATIAKGNVIGRSGQSVPVRLKPGCMRIRQSVRVQLAGRESPRQVHASGAAVGSMAGSRTKVGLQLGLWSYTNVACLLGAGTGVLHQGTKARVETAKYWGR